MSHAVIRGAEWVVSAERAECAPDGLYGARCLRCGAGSPLSDNDPKPVGMWALDHTRWLGLEHSQFVVTSQRHWRVDPALPVARVKRPDQARSPRAHARPRGGLRRSGRRAMRSLGRRLVAIAARWLPILTAARGGDRT
ncbi:DUF7848 domain-containing protein [Streptomyces specialis]